MLTEDQKAALIKRHATTYRNRVVDTKALGFTEADLNALIADVEQAVRKEMEGELNTLKADRDELIFLRDDLLYWVDRAVDKGNANSDIEEATARYYEWLQDRAAIDAARGQT